MKTFADFINEEKVPEALDMRSILKIKAEKWFKETYSAFPGFRATLRKGTKDQILDMIKRKIKINNIPDNEFEKIVMDVRDKWVKKEFK